MSCLLAGVAVGPSPGSWLCPNICPLWWLARVRREWPGALSLNVWTWPPRSFDPRFCINVPRWRLAGAAGTKLQSLGVPPHSSAPPSQRRDLQSFDKRWRFARPPARMKRESQGPWANGHTLTTNTSRLEIRPSLSLARGPPSRRPGQQLRYLAVPAHRGPGPHRCR